MVATPTHREKETVSRTRQILLLLLVAGFLLPGCALKEVRSKTKLGPEFRHKGSNRTESVRWTAQQGVELKWEGGVSTGLTYRRRDTDAGSGDHDDGVWLDFSFPLWKAPKKPDTMKDQMEALARRLATLEAQLQLERTAQ